jgi:hypothetical protein
LMTMKTMKILWMMSSSLYSRKLASTLSIFVTVYWYCLSFRSAFPHTVYCLLFTVLKTESRHILITGYCFL